ncbi:aquaporin-like protein [Irpex rosettiformis]|uniref:Aquaporin-like protein n=1 Tax=Irpex rosettiformis TaxID=378272 RepID=A0ACB8TUF2_9APHY|nr:aquaporin-like protein [Irpex rosettiformis]
MTQVDLEQGQPSLNAMRSGTNPPLIARKRGIFPELAAEFFGVLILVVFGTGVNCAVTLSSNPGSVLGPPKGDWVSVSFGRAAGIGLGVWISSRISAGHVNPAATLAMAIIREFSWKKVPLYVFAQLLGGICGAGIVYGNYIHAIDAFEGGRHIRTLATAGLFDPPAADYLTNISAFFEEFLGTAILLFAICSARDKREGTDSQEPTGIHGDTAERAAIVAFITILGISISIGAQTGFSLNPARDLGPRILTAMVGYGRQVGVSAYDFFFYTGKDSIFNKE